MSVNCVYCGHVNPDGSTVCQSCGRTLPPPSSGGGQGQQPWGSQDQGRQSSYPPADPYGSGGGYGQSQSYGNQQSYPGYGQPQYQQPSSYGHQPGWQPPPGAMAGGFVNPEVAAAQKNAMISMILSIAGVPTVFCCIGLVLGIVGIVMGMKAKSTLQGYGVQDGQSQATAGIVLGWICVGLWVLFMIINMLSGLVG